MRSISCQTENKENIEVNVEKLVENEVPVYDLQKEEKDRSRLERCNSLKDKKKKDKKTEAFSRSSSLRYGEDKAKVIIKDINLNTSDAYQDKDKGQTNIFTMFHAFLLVISLNFWNKKFLTLATSICKYKI